MILIIDTNKNNEIKISLQKGNKTFEVVKKEAKYSQAEKLLPLIDVTLKKNNLKLKDLSEIRVADKGDSFTALRIGITTANALGYALGIKVKPISAKKNFKTEDNSKFSLVKPRYNREASVG